MVPLDRCRRLGKGLPGDPEGTARLQNVDQFQLLHGVPGPALERGERDAQDRSAADVPWGLCYARLPSGLSGAAAGG